MGEGKADEQHVASNKHKHKQAGARVGDATQRNGKGWPYGVRVTIAGCSGGGGKKGGREGVCRKFTFL